MVIKVIKTNTYLNKKSRILFPAKIKIITEGHVVDLPNMCTQMS